MLCQLHIATGVHTGANCKGMRMLALCQHSSFDGTQTAISAGIWLQLPSFARVNSITSHLLALVSKFTAPSQCHQAVLDKGVAGCA